MPLTLHNRLGIIEKKKRAFAPQTSAWGGIQAYPKLQMRFAEMDGLSFFDAM
jgi:hypothetical protein